MKALTGVKPVTIYEVARRAGVSIATVSRALRGSELVAAETLTRVRAAADELDFRPSRLGRSLAEGRHAANGIVFPDLVGPYYAEVVLAYEEVASDLGRSVLILATHRRRDAVDRVLELAQRVDGMAIMGNTVDDDTVERIAAAGIPVVLLARPPVGDLDTIRTRNEETAVELAQHIVHHGHRRVVFLGDPDASPDVAGRYLGLSRGLRLARRARPAVVPIELDVEAGEAATRRLLARQPRPDALVCANDEVALGAHLAAEEAGLRVPTDLAITGWDDILGARFAGLTTVRQPMRDLGATAARWLHERLEDPARPVRQQVLPTQLVVRRSCGIHHPEVER